MVGVTADDNLFSDVLAPRFNIDPNAEISSTLPAFHTICFIGQKNYHFESTFVNICCVF